ncbi:unnamed protein product, partial [Owenia fusiformis]
IILATFELIDLHFLLAEHILVLGEHGCLVYQCTTCQVTYGVDSKRPFLTHMRGHNGAKMLPCSLCEKQMSNFTLFIDHMLRHQGIKQPQVVYSRKPWVRKCDLCSKVLKSAKAFNHHLAAMHAKEKSFKCGKCGKSFGAEYILKLHMQRHAEKNIICNDCGRKFLDIIALKRHMVMHTGDKKFKCKSCTQGFLHRYLLLRHYRETKECASKAKVEIAKFVCDICGTEHITKRGMEDHKVRAHGITQNTAEFKCNICDKVYLLAKDLQQHIRQSHLKNHKCTNCGKSFGTSRALKQHMRTHTGEKPFKCNQCDKTYTQYGSLYQHKRRHSKDETESVKLNMKYSTGYQLGDTKPCVVAMSSGNNLYPVRINLSTPETDPSKGYQTMNDQGKSVNPQIEESGEVYPVYMYPSCPSDTSEYQGPSISDSITTHQSP